MLATILLLNAFIKTTLQLNLKKWYELKIQNLQFKNQTSIDEKFAELFINSVDKRLRSDVAVGTSLSGGIDSAAVLAAIHHLKKQKNISDKWSNVAFTAVFLGFEKNEAANSKTTAEYFDAAQFITTPSAKDCIEHFNEIMYYQDEPVQSSSIVTQFFVYRLAKERKVTVLLDGQGADEILGGYKKYTHWYLQQLLKQNFNAFKNEKKLLEQNNFIENMELEKIMQQHFYQR